MEILIVSATPFEIAPTLGFLESNFNTDQDFIFDAPSIRVHVCITGVGMMATAWHLGQSIAQTNFDLVINAGVAGAFDRSLQLGAVVQVISDRFGDLGVEEANGTFTDMYELGLISPNQTPFVNGILYNPIAHGSEFLQNVNGLTVNRVHGNSNSIQSILKKYPEAQIETMESAAVFYSCLLAGTRFIAIRSISNYVEPRNRDAWKLDLAIDRLNAVILEMLQSFTPPGP